MVCVLDEVSPLSLKNVHVCRFLPWNPVHVIQAQLHALISGCYLLGASSSTSSLWVFIFVETGHLKAVCSWVLHFNPSFYSVLFDWWVQSAYMYGDYWYMRTYYSLFIFSGGSAFSLFLFPCVDIYYLSLVVFYKFFLFIFLNVTCLSYITHFYFIVTSRFMWKILVLHIP